MPWYREFQEAHEEPFVTVTPGRHPFEVAAFAALLVEGIAGVFSRPSDAVQAAFPPYAMLFLYSMAALWSAVGLTGLVLRDQVLRLSIEIIACRGIAAVVIAFVATATIVAGWTGIGTAMTGVGWVAVGAGWRGYQIRQDLKRLRAVRARLSREPPDEEDEP